MIPIATKTSTSFHVDKFRRPTLMDPEQKTGCRPGLDTWADISCSGKHAFVEEFMEDKIVTTIGST